MVAIYQVVVGQIYRHAHMVVQVIVVIQHQMYHVATQTQETAIQQHHVIMETQNVQAAAQDLIVAKMNGPVRIQTLTVICLIIAIGQV